MLDKKIALYKLAESWNGAVSGALVRAETTILLPLPKDVCEDVVEAFKAWLRDRKSCLVYKQHESYLLVALPPAPTEAL